jgi:integrase
VSGRKTGPLLTMRTERLARAQMFLLLQRVAHQANAHLPAGERLKVSPHVLRHMFLRKLAEEKGVQYAKGASGHKSDRDEGTQAACQNLRTTKPFSKLRKLPESEGNVNRGIQRLTRFC